MEGGGAVAAPCNRQEISARTEDRYVPPLHPDFSQIQFDKAYAISNEEEARELRDRLMENESFIERIRRLFEGTQPLEVR